MLEPSLSLLPLSGAPDNPDIAAKVRSGSEQINTNTNANKSRNTNTNKNKGSDALGSVLSR